MVPWKSSQFITILFCIQFLAISLFSIDVGSHFNEEYTKSAHLHKRKQRFTEKCTDMDIRMEVNEACEHAMMYTSNPIAVHALRAAIGASLGHLATPLQWLFDSMLKIAVVVIGMMAVQLFLWRRGPSNHLQILPLSLPWKQDTTTDRDLERQNELLNSKLNRIIYHTDGKFGY